MHPICRFGNLEVVNSRCRLCVPGEQVDMQTNRGAHRHGPGVFLLLEVNSLLATHGASFAPAATTLTNQLLQLICNYPPFMFLFLVVLSSTTSLFSALVPASLIICRFVSCYSSSCTDAPCAARWPLSPSPPCNQLVCQLMPIC